MSVRLQLLLCACPLLIFFFLCYTFFVILYRPSATFLETMQDDPSIFPSRATLHTVRPCNEK